MRVASLLFSCALAVAVSASTAAADPPNLLVIVADDVGVDLLGSYGELRAGAATPREHLATPNLDALAAAGVLFRNVWSTPYCSASRAALLTGRYGFRTNVGSAFGNLSPAETILPTVLRQHAAYASAAFGKWHVTPYEPANGGAQSGYTPAEAGFDLFRGTAENLSGGEHYFLWNKAIEIRGGASTYLTGQTKYAPTDTVDDALGWITAQQGPWFAYVALHSIHAPRQVPPDELHTQDDVKSLYAPGDQIEGRAVNTAMLEAMDTEIGRLLAAIDPATTTIFFLGDNGTVKSLSVPERINRGGKGEVWEGGINVPLLVTGAGVTAPPGSEASTLAHAVDLFATLLELAGVPPEAMASPGRPLDSSSLVPALADPNAALRSSVYTDGSFESTSLRGPRCHEVAIRGPRYKIIRRSDPITIEFYDLVADPRERIDLMSAPLSPEQGAALNALYVELEAVTAGGAGCGASSCGVGAELPLALAPLLWLSARRRAKR